MKIRLLFKKNVNYQFKMVNINVKFFYLVFFNFPKVCVQVKCFYEKNILTNLVVKGWKVLN